jgi:hypothetical protein
MTLSGQEPAVYADRRRMTVAAHQNAWMILVADGLEEQLSFADRGGVALVNRPIGSKSIHVTNRLPQHV